jgi:hypothetical protein
MRNKSSSAAPRTLHRADEQKDARWSDNALLCEERKGGVEPEMCLKLLVYAPLSYSCMWP